MASPRALFVAVVVALLTSGCFGASPSSQANGTGSSTTGVKATTPTTLDPGCKYLIVGTAPHKTVAPPVEDLVLLTDAVAMPDVCYDKITFTFRPTRNAVPPGYNAEYVDGPATEPNDKGVLVNSPHVEGGKAWLVVTFTPAQSHDKSKSGQPLTYFGNLSLLFEPLQHVLLVHKHLNDGDTTVTWLIELDEKRPFIVDAYVTGSTPKVNVLIMH